MTRLPFSTAAEREEAAPDVRRHLQADGIIAYPTETVYGLGCALRSAPLARLADFKGPRPFLLLIPDAAAADRLVWTEPARRLAEAFWPGPLTLALDDPHHTYPDQVRGAEGTVAVRVSPHPAIPTLLAAAGGPLTSTSANRPGGAAARSGVEAAVLRDHVDRLLVLDAGALPAAEPSTIVRCGASTHILREGAVSRSAIERVIELE